jgi:hypothetical protein
MATARQMFGFGTNRVARQNSGEPPGMGVDDRLKAAQRAKESAEKKADQMYKILQQMKKSGVNVGQDGEAILRG